MRKEHITLEVQDLLKQYATHPQVVALNTLLNNKTSRNIFLKGLNGSGKSGILVRCVQFFSKGNKLYHNSGFYTASVCPGIWAVQRVYFVVRYLGEFRGIIAVLRRLQCRDDEI